MKNKQRKFKPFTHENLELKNELVNLARSATQGEFDIQKHLSSIFIYSNIAEYLAQNLLDHLNHFIYKGTYNFYSAIIFIERATNDTANLTLGSAITQLEKFEFPDKYGLIICLKNICDSRNKIFHNFAKSSMEDIGKMIQEDFPTIQKECEDLIVKHNVVLQALQKIEANPINLPPNETPKP